MSVEQEQPAKIPKPAEEFGLTEREQLFDRVSHTRFLALLEEPATTVHQLEKSYNNHGEYLFVTLSRPGTNRRIYITFWGLGYHEYRERWIVDEWSWYQSLRELESESVPRETARELIEERRKALQAYGQENNQTRRGQVFEMLADLTDEDGAYTEMEDLGDMADWLLDGEE